MKKLKKKYPNQSKEFDNASKSLTDCDNSYITNLGLGNNDSSNTPNESLDKQPIGGFVLSGRERALWKAGGGDRNEFRRVFRRRRIYSLSKWG